MLAILTALTEIITERGGSQSSTEYFVALVSIYGNFHPEEILKMFIF